MANKLILCFCSALLLQVSCTTYAVPDQCEEPGGYVTFRIDSGYQNPALVAEVQSILKQVLSYVGLEKSFRAGYTNDFVCTGEIVVIRGEFLEAPEVAFKTTISTRGDPTLQYRYRVVMDQISEKVVELANQNEKLAGKVLALAVIRVH